MLHIPRHRTQNKGTPAYSIRKLEGSYEMTLAKMIPLSDKKDKNGNQKYKMEFETVRRPCGFLIETPMTRGGYNRNGTFHIPVQSLDELTEYGYDTDEVPMVHPEMDGAIDSIPLRLKKDKTNA